MKFAMLFSSEFAHAIPTLPPPPEPVLPPPVLGGVGVGLGVDEVVFGAWTGAWLVVLMALLLTAWELKATGEVETTLDDETREEEGRALQRRRLVDLVVCLLAIRSWRALCRTK